MPGVQTHLTVSGAGLLTLRHEMNMDRAQVEALADVVHPAHDVGAQIASGSFQCEGMVIAPCSMRSLAAVALGLSDNLVTRAADVMLKERRRLVLMVRETPLNLAHLRNMTAVTEMGGIIFPPVPSFYQAPDSVEALVNQTVSRVLDVLGLPQSDVPRWSGLPQDLAPLPALA
jgi:4-hydroxy-3-polyprenylbenzoate decarboxylase